MVGLHDEQAALAVQTLSGPACALRKKPALGFSECVILQVARAAGHLPRGTFERDPGKLAGAEPL